MRSRRHPSPLPPDWLPSTTYSTENHAGDMVYHSKRAFYIDQGGVVRLTREAARSGRTLSVLAGRSAASGPMDEKRPYYTNRRMRCTVS